MFFQASPLPVDSSCWNSIWRNDFLEQKEKMTTGQAEIVELTCSIKILHDFIQDSFVVKPLAPVATSTTPGPQTPTPDSFSPRTASPLADRFIQLIASTNLPYLKKKTSNGPPWWETQWFDNKGRVPRRRRNYCDPGGKVDDITATIDEVFVEAANGSSFCSSCR